MEAQPTKSNAPPRRIKLTQSFVDSSKPGPRDRIWWDTQQLGLGLKITPAGRKSFVVIYRHAGKPVWFRIDDARAIKLATARKLAEQIRARAVLGEHPQGEKLESRRQKGETFDQLAQDFFAANPGSQYLGHYERHLKKPLGKRLARELTQDDVIPIRRKLTEAGKTGSIGPILAAGSKIWTEAADDGRVPLAGNPFRGIKTKHKAAERRALEDDEIRKLCEAEPGEPWAAILRLMLFTGQRFDEIRRLRWDDIDGEWWTQKSNKAKRIHRVYLTQPVLDVLAAQPRVGELVFPNRSGEPHGQFSHPVVRRIKSATGIEDFTPHMLRHTVATKLSQLGVPAEHRSKVLNHAEGGVTAKYSHYDFDTERRAALVKLARHLESILGLAEDNVVAIA